MLWIFWGFEDNQMTWEHQPSGIGGRKEDSILPDHLNDLSVLRPDEKNMHEVFDQ
jgi:hypothetical protein